MAHGDTGVGYGPGMGGERREIGRDHGLVDVPRRSSLSKPLVLFFRAGVHMHRHVGRDEGIWQGAHWSLVAVTLAVKRRRMLQKPEAVECRDGERCWHVKRAHRLAIVLSERGTGFLRVGRLGRREREVWRERVYVPLGRLIQRLEVLTRP